MSDKLTGKLKDTVTGILKEACCCQTGKGTARPSMWGVYWVDYVCPVHGRQQHYDTYDAGNDK